MRSACRFPDTRARPERRHGAKRHRTAGIGIGRGWGDCKVLSWEECICPFPTALAAWGNRRHLGLSLLGLARSRDSTAQQVAEAPGLGGEVLRIARAGTDDDRHALGDGDAEPNGGTEVPLG